MIGFWKEKFFILYYHVWGLDLKIKNSINKFGLKHQKKIKLDNLYFGSF